MTTGTREGPGRTAPHVLREYAFLADGERGVLVGPRGDFVWMCFPGWDSGAVFSSLIGGRGVYAIAPTAPNVWGGYYEPGTLIWRSRWVTEDNAIVECREALALPASRDRAVVLRRVVALAGTARVDVHLSPHAGYGREPVESVSRTDEAGWTLRTGDIHARWIGAEAARPVRDDEGGPAFDLSLEVDEGAHHDLVLVFALDAKKVDAPDPAESWSATEAAWHERVPALEETVGTRDARHAYAVLSGLTSSGGGTVAAATMSLPERSREGRSYDYRYVWIRDQCYAGQAVARAGPYPLLADATSFVRERLLEDGPDLMPAYTTGGERVPDERELDLPGYPGGTNVVGNHVNQQFQLDAFGEALLLLAAAAEHELIDADGWRAAEIAAAAIERRRHEPDTGVWELYPDEWTHSRLICAAGLRAISRHDTAGRNGPKWLALADAITAEMSARSLHPSGRWQRSPTDERLDAALLFPALRGAIPADDPRSRATLGAFGRELTEDGYAYRYRPDERPLGDAEGAFLMCGFVVSLAWWQQGNGVEAARWFERTRSACGPPGLLSEEFDVTQRQLRGNLPQAFVHGLLLECAAALARA